MSPHQQPESYTPWLQQLATSASKTITVPNGITSTEGMLLEIRDDVPVDSVLNLVVQLCTFDKKSIFQQAVVRYNIGRMILEVCARTNQTEDQVIMDHGLCDKTGMKAATLINWTGTVKRCPPSFLRPGISWSILSEMGNVAQPSDPAKLLELRGEQEKIIEAATENPQEYSARDVRAGLKDIMEKLEIKPPSGPTPYELLLDGYTMLRKLRFADGHQWTEDEEYLAIGYKSRRDLVDAIENVDASLVNMEIISATVEEQE